MSPDCLNTNNRSQARLFFVAALVVIVLASLAGYRLALHDSEKVSGTSEMPVPAPAASLSDETPEMRQMESPPPDAISLTENADERIPAEAVSQSPAAAHLQTQSQPATNPVSTHTPSQSRTNAASQEQRGYKVPAIFASAEALQGRFTASPTQGVSGFAPGVSGAGASSTSRTVAATAFNDEIRSASEPAAVKQLQERFVSEMQRSGLSPETPEYLDAWERTREMVDSQYRIRFGWDAYNRRERDAYILARQLSHQTQP
jgi:hypothetical protein